MALRFSRRHGRVGAPPGTLRAPERRVDELAISVIRYGPDGCEESRAEAAADLTPLVPKLGRTPYPVTWIDIVGLHDLAVLEELARLFALHTLALEDVLNTGQRPKMEDYEGTLFIVLRHFHHPPAEEDEIEELVPEQISMFVRPGLVITLQEVEGDAFEPVRERIRRGGNRLRNRGSDYLAYALVDALVDSYFPILERLGEHIESLEEELIADPTPETLDRIYRLRRDLLLLRRAAWPTREMINSLLRDDNPLITDETRLYLRDCYDHAVETLEIVETYRELGAGMLDVYLSSLSQKMNEVMKVLTIIATIFIPLTFVAGIYGMNFAYMPELQHRFGYPAALAVMAAIALTLVAYFRRKGWM
jgi:magnesium transporter